MGSHRRLAPSGFDRGAGAAVGFLSVAATALCAVPAASAPYDDTRAEVDRLYEQAEKATEAYNKADERADELREEAGTARDRIARQQQRINSMRDALGSLAGAQYRSGDSTRPSPCCSPTTRRTTSTGPPGWTASPPTRPVS